MYGKRTTFWLVSVLLLACSVLVGACGEDEGREEKCGNGVIDHDEFETCDGENLNYRTCLDLAGFSGGTLRCGPDCRFDTSGCTISCGNGMVDVGEGCDGLNLNNKSCRDLGFSGGNLACQSDCEFDTSSCIDLCGNNTIDEQEECDGTDLAGKTCVDFGYVEGTLGCTAGCFFNTIKCTNANCGNDKVDAGEECDGADLNMTTCEDLDFAGGTLLCNLNCTFNTGNCIDMCGNNVLDAGEECDGINLNNTTCQDLGYQTGDLACLDDCTFDTSGCSGGELCGNGMLDAGEECDGADLNGLECVDLGWTGGTLACDEFCGYDTLLCEGDDPCGNGTIDLTEECDGDDLNNLTCADLGFSSGDLYCAYDCTLDTLFCTNCGNGIIDFGEGEECDGRDLAHMTCQDFGFDGGDLACSADCEFDMSGCSGCTDDIHEENDDQGQAVGLSEGTHAGLVLCNPAGAEEDWFSFDMQAASSLAVVLEFDSSILDLDTKLLDAAGAELASSGTTANQEIMFYDTTEAQTVFVRIYPYNDASGVVDYNLTLNANPECEVHADCPPGQLCEYFSCVDFVCDDQNPCPAGLVCNAGTCVECITADDCPNPSAYTCENNVCVLSCNEDAYEPNSTSADAAGISLDFSEAGLTLCGESDEDWFQVDLAELGLYDFQFLFAHTDGDIDAFLYAAGDTATALASGTSVNDNEVFSHAVPPGGAGSYLIKVKLYGFGVLSQVYDMSVTYRGATECFVDADCNPGQVCVDNVCIDALTGDSCADPVVVSALPFNVTDVTIAVFSNQLQFVDGNPPACTGYATTGKDVVYRVALGAGQTLSASLYSTYDGALYVVDDCSVQPMPESACLDGADAVGADDTETVEYSAAGPGTVYVVVDHWQTGPSSGTFTLDISVQ